MRSLLDLPIVSSRHLAANRAVSDAFDHARTIALAVHDAGGRALFVGGWVRDKLMGRDSKNIDIEVFGLPPDRVKSILESIGRVDEVGASFQVRSEEHTSELQSR